MEKHKFLLVFLVWLLFLGTSFALDLSDEFVIYGTLMVLLLCAALEFLVYEFMIEGKTVYKYGFSLVVNLITLFPANFGISWLLFVLDLPYGVSIGVVEFLVILSEAAMLKYFFKLGLKKALKVSAVANLVSFLPSFIFLFPLI